MRRPVYGGLLEVVVEDRKEDGSSVETIGLPAAFVDAAPAPLRVPRAVPGLATTKVLVMEFVEGVSLNNLAAEARKRGVEPGSPGHAAGLTSILDYIVVANGVRLETDDGAFVRMIQECKGQDMRLCVFNTHTLRTRARPSCGRTTTGAARGCSASRSAST